MADGAQLLAEAGKMLMVYHFPMSHGPNNERNIWKIYEKEC